ncbi:reverse transcriptase domain-containing protein [Tanacetum coccineum]
MLLEHQDIILEWEGCVLWRVLKGCGYWSFIHHDGERKSRNLMSRPKLDRIRNLRYFRRKLNDHLYLESSRVSLCRLHSDAIALNLLTSLQGVATPSPATVWIFFKIVGVADLGASINFMPYSLYAKLSLETLKHAKMSVRLADISFYNPVGIAENMLVEVGKFTFPADFVILEMEEDSKVPHILG